MKTSPKLVLALLAAVSCAAGAETYSSQADQARRERNREEVMAKHGLDNSATYRSDSTTHRVEEKKTLKSETNRAVAATKNFGHRTADKMREFGAKTDAKFDHKGSPQKSPYQHGPQ